jgi:NADPH:quinone reductase
VNGRTDNIAAEAMKFAPGGLDAALFTAGGEAAQKALAAMRKGGRIAYPNGVDPEPQAPAGVTSQGYDGMPDPKAIEKLNALIESGPFYVHVARTFSLDQITDAHKALDTHYLGKLALRPV